MRKRLSPWVLLVCAVLLLFIVYLTAAVWPLFVSSRGFSGGTHGLILGFYGLALVVARLPIGFLSDLLIGYRRILISVGFLSIALGLFLPGLFTSAWPLFASRVLMGVSTGTFVVIVVLYTLYFPPRSARVGTAVVASFWGWSQIPATSLGGWLADSFGVLMPFWVSALVAIVGAVLILTIIEPGQERAPMQRVLLPRSANLYIMAVMMAIVFLAVFATVYNVTQLYASSQLGISQTTQGLLLMTFVSAFVAVVLSSPYLARTLGATYVITAGMAFVGGGVLLTPVASLSVLFLCEALIGIGVGLTFGLLMALSIEGIPAGQRFYAMGIFQSIYAVGLFFGPWTAGYFTQALGFPLTFFSIGSLVLLAGAWFLLARVDVFRATVRLVRG
ncbi:MAG: MFS transporter [Dehalococcoidia bacterium]